MKEVLFIGSNMTLGDTVDLMKSEDYKARFKAEYYQTKIRYEKLHAFNIRIDAANMTKRVFRSETYNPVEIPKHDCPDHLLDQQESVMKEYLNILEKRAVIEGIEL